MIESRKTIDYCETDQSLKSIANYNHLTSREKEITECICIGMRNKEIAEASFLSENTLRNHI